MPVNFVSNQVLSFSGTTQAGAAQEVVHHHHLRARETSGARSARTLTGRQFQFYPQIILVFSRAFPCCAEEEEDQEGNGLFGWVGCHLFSSFWMGRLSSYRISDDFHLSIQVFTPLLYPGSDLHFNAHCTTHPAIFPLCMSKGENMPFSVTIYIQDIDHFYHIFILAFKVVQEYERAVIFR